jgi:hypothetical protein
VHDHPCNLGFEGHRGVLVHVEAIDLLSNHVTCEAGTALEFPSIKSADHYLGRGLWT